MLLYLLSLILVSVSFFFFFFFSSRRRHTRFDCDWSSDVCSSDLPRQAAVLPAPFEQLHRRTGPEGPRPGADAPGVEPRQVEQLLGEVAQPERLFEERLPELGELHTVELVAPAVQRRRNAVDDRERCAQLM